MVKALRIITVIESPFAGAVERNVGYARRAMRDSIDRAEVPWASHLLYTQPGVLDDSDPEQRRHGIDLNLQVIEFCARNVAVYADHGISPGMREAIKLATKLYIPVDIRYLGEGPVKAISWRVQDLLDVGAA